MSVNLSWFSNIQLNVQIILVLRQLPINDIFVPFFFLDFQFEVHIPNKSRLD